MLAREGQAKGPSGKYGGCGLLGPTENPHSKAQQEAPGGLGDLMHMERPTELKHINQWRK